MGAPWKETVARECLVEVHLKNCTAATRDGGLASWVPSQAEPTKEKGPGAAANGA